MDLITLITACAVSAHANVAPLLYQIARVHDGDPYAVEVVEEQRVYRPDTPSAAADLTLHFLESGHELRVGLGHVDPAAAVEIYEISVTALFENYCQHIQIAADQLTRRVNEYRPTARALAAYYAVQDDPNDSHARLWAEDVMSQPHPPANPGDDDLPRRYEPPADRLFTGRSDESADSSPSFETIFPNTREFETAEPADEADAESSDESESVPSRTIDRSSGPRPYPDVTDETLPTTEELSE